MKAYITIGLPASGKTTWAKDFCDKNSTDDNIIIRVNNDDIRNAIYDLAGNRNWSGAVEDEVKKNREILITARADVGADIIIDNTHLNPKTLNHITNFCKSKGYEIEIVDFRHVSLEECIRRDSLREGFTKVGEKVIRDMHNKFMNCAVDRNLPEWVPNSLPNCIIVDIDGTVARIVSRGPYDESLVFTDDVRQHVLLVVRSIIEANPHTRVFFFSGRSEGCKGETIRWLNTKCNIAIMNEPPILKDDLNFNNPMMMADLHMRKIGDRRRDSFVKLDMYNEIIKDKYNVICVFDDRPQVIRECWKVLNLPVLNCGVIDNEF